MIPSLPDEVREMANVLLEHARPLVGEMTKENQVALFPDRPLLVAYFDVDWDKSLKKGRKISYAVLVRHKPVSS